MHSFIVVTSEVDPVDRRGTKIEIQWIIYNILDHILGNGIILTPPFLFANTEWYLRLCHETGVIKVSLVKRPSPFSLRISINTGFKNRQGEVMTGMERTEEYGCHQRSTVINFVRRAVLLNFLDHVQLIVTCTLQRITSERTAATGNEAANGAQLGKGMKTKK